MGNSIPDLDVDVNGEAIFSVNKRIIACYSGRISKLVNQSNDTPKRLKVILEEFPGGAEIFELILKFCYNNGRLEMKASTISGVKCAASFMEMKRDVLGTDNLYEQSERLLEEIQYWSWGEVVVALNQCKSFLDLAVSSGVLQKLLDSIVWRIVASFETTPSSSSSSDCSSGCRFSCDTAESLKNTTTTVTWWFDDLAMVQSDDLIRILVTTMIAKNIDNGLISRFLFYYQKSRLSSIETVADILDRLDVSLISIKSLFRLLRIGSSMNVSQKCIGKLERMIGSQLDRATLDSLLVPPPMGADHLYDVKFVLRLVKSFLYRGACAIRLKKVGGLMDLYLAEIAPDPRLKPSTFAALVKALPDSARESFDGVNAAVKLYLKVHSGLSEEEKMMVCSGVVRSGGRNGQQVDVCGVRAQLQEMQWRAMELEKVCHQLGLQMAKASNVMMKSKLCT